MKRQLFTFFLFLFFLHGAAQIKLDAEIGLMRSVNRMDGSGDPQKSMSLVPAISLFTNVHMNVDIGNYFNAGLHFMIQKQNAKVKYNDDYYSSQKPSAPFYEGAASRHPSNSEVSLNHYSMLGPEFSGRIPLGNSFEIEARFSCLFYDNRQFSDAFDNYLKTQIGNKNYYSNYWNNYIYIYRHETEFLNAWNMKINGAMRLTVTPFKSRYHKISIGFSAGRSIKQNYAVNFRTNKPDTETGSNVLRVENYGAYYGLSLGYSYWFQFRPIP